MAWEWASEQTGTLRVQYDGSSNTKSFSGINVGVLDSDPDYAVGQANKLVDIGGLSVVTTASTKFTETSGVIDNE